MRGARGSTADECLLAVVLCGGPVPADRHGRAAALRGESRGSTADKYLLAVVLYAAALFQLGIQSRIGVFELRRVLVTVAAAS